MSRFTGIHPIDRRDQVVNDRRPRAVGMPTPDGDDAGGGFNPRRNALIDQFPGVRRVSAFASVIPAPAAGFTVPTGQAAWYGLQEVEVGKLVASEFSLSSIYGTMLACDPDGNGGNSGAANPQAWGNDDGTGAAVVVGLDLPVRAGTWAASRCDAPGLGATNSGDNPGWMSRYAAVFHFPPGKINDDVKAKLYPALSYAPGAVRVFDQRRLGVAFVLNRTDANAAAGAGNNLGCFLEFGLNIASTMQDKFQQ